MTSTYTKSGIFFCTDYQYFYSDKGIDKFKFNQKWKMKKLL